MKESWEENRDLPPGVDVGPDGNLMVSGIPLKELWRLYHVEKMAYPDILVRHPHISLVHLDAAIRYAEARPEKFGS